MTTVFVDTSALYGLLVPESRSHAAARAALTELQAEAAELVTSSYVLHEVIALIQARIGIDAVRRLVDLFVPLLEVVWIDRALHERAVAALLAASSRKVSLTDWTSFAIMHERGIERAFAFDAHFAAQGFALFPETRA